MAVTWNVVSYNATKTVGSLSNVVNAVHWTANDSETVGSGESAVVHNGSQYGSIRLADADAGSFIELGSITQENLVAWVKARLGSEEVAIIETNIAAEITESKNPSTFSGAPS